MFFHSIRYHRNGSFGAGFYAINLSWTCEGKRYNGTAIVFENLTDPEADALEGCISILDQHGDSWRYEDFASAIRAFVISQAAQSMAFA